MTSSIIDKKYLPDLDLSEEDLSEISMILSMRRSFDISAYKDNYLRRRVAIRMRTTRCSTPGDYCDLLRQNNQELEQLQKILTIHVSQFFRNPSLFIKLRDDLLPGFFANSKDEPLKIWSLGCAAGEEAYSMAIMLQESFSQEIADNPPSIIGTDIDLGILHAARKAKYSFDRIKELPEELIQRYFSSEGSLYSLKEEITSMVTFVQADITNVDQFLASDVVLCRNTLIYFTRGDQEKILIGISAILPPGGLLVLGKSETLVGSSRILFESVCPVERIYRRL